MIYSKTAKYAVLAMAETAAHDGDAPVSTRAIAQQAGVPYALLAKIVGQLRRAGLVTSKRGKQGGIHLAKPAADISILDIVVAIDGPGVLADCPLYLQPCHCDRQCSLHALWQPARDGVVHFLRSTTIEAVADARGKAVVSPPTDGTNR